MIIIYDNGNDCKEKVDNKCEEEVEDDDECEEEVADVNIDDKNSSDGNDDNNDGDSDKLIYFSDSNATVQGDKNDNNKISNVDGGDKEGGDCNSITLIYYY